MSRTISCLVGLLLLVAGCTGGSGEDARPTSDRPDSTAAETPSATTAPEPPRTGACYRLTLAEAAQPSSGAEPVPCRGRHTTRTIFVGNLDTVVDGHSLAVDSRHVQRQLEESCPARLAAYLGGDRQARALSRFQVVWFSPTLEQFDAGATWFRCDVVAFGRDDALLTLPVRGLRDVLDRPRALREYGLCGTARPGAPGFRRVACRLPHSWVAVATLPLEGGDRYPGTRVVRQAGDQPCADTVRARNDFLLEFSYGWEWPTRKQWRAGQRYGYCWAPADLA
jgi:hypothetical protein